MPRFTATIRVRWGDCDPAGVAFYPRFFEWMDVVADDLHHVLRVKRTERKLRSGLPLVEVSGEFIVPARAEDVLQISACCTAIRTTSFVLRHDFVRTSDGVLLARGTERRVFVEFDEQGEFRPVPLTEDMRATLVLHGDAPLCEPSSPAIDPDG